MDKLRTLMWALLFTTVCSNSVSSASPCQPDNLKASQWDGELMVVWDPPSDVTPLSRYSVQMSKYNEKWLDVSNCMLIQDPFCDLTWIIDNYFELYRVRVQTVTAKGVSEWAVLRKILPNNSNLRPPSFTLRPSSSSLTVTVENKPLVRKISMYGMTYTMVLEEKGQPNETMVVYLKDDTEGAEGRSHTFRALRWGREYCVRLQVEADTGLQRSNVSAQQCVQLPDPEWYSVTLPCLAVLAVLAVIMAALCSFLRHPEKTPLALKPLEKSWSPLRLGEGPMEVVTDKGWLLCMPKTPLEGWGNPGTHTLEGRGDTAPRNLEAFRPETDWKSERRSSMDSGVSVSSNGATKTGGSDAARQEYSGCASGGGSQSGGGESPRAPGVSVSVSGCSVSSEGPDRGAEQSEPAADPCRHREGAGVGGPTPGGEPALKEVRAEGAAPPGYRRGPPPAVPSGYQPAVHTNYRRKTHIMMETLVSVDDSDSPSERTHAAAGEESPALFLPLTFLPSLRGELGGGMATISLSDVELWGE